MLREIVSAVGFSTHLGTWEQVTVHSLHLNSLFTLCIYYTSFWAFCQWTFCKLFVKVLLREIVSAVGFSTHLGTWEQVTVHSLHLNSLFLSLPYILIILPFKLFVKPFSKFFFVILHKFSFIKNLQSFQDLFINAEPQSLQKIFFLFTIYSHKVDRTHQKRSTQVNEFFVKKL